MNLVIAKLKEGSTWAGLGVLVGGMTFIPHAPELAKLAAPLGVVVGRSEEHTSELSHT